MLTVCNIAALTALLGHVNLALAQSAAWGQCMLNYLRPLARVYHG